MRGERDRRQPQARRPALGALVQARDGRVRRARCPAASSSSPRLLQREAQIVAADLRQLAVRRRRCSPSPGSSRVASTTCSLRRQPRQERARASRSASGERSSCRSSTTSTTGSSSASRSREQRLDHGLAAERRRGADALDQPLLADGAGQRVDDRQPEVLRVLLAALDRHPRDAVRRGLGLGPRAQQDRLAAARGRAQQDDLARAGIGQAPNSGLRGTSRRIAGSRSPVAGKGCSGVSRTSAVSARIVMTIRTRPCSSDPARWHASGAEP